MMRSILPVALALPPLLVSGCIVIPVGDLLRGPALEEQVLAAGDGFFSKDKIAIVEIDGIITGGESMGILGAQENTVAETKARLDRVRYDPEVRGIVLRISSPGGEVTACDVIHHELVELKKSARIPVVAVIVDEGASGGYYVASAADLIVAQPTAVVGSIGVILQTFNLAGLLGKIGVETQPVKSAEKKDILSPFRARTEEETAILQGVVNDLYQRFVAVVAERPGGLPREEVLRLADGRIFSGVEAQKLRLVDRIGYVADAVQIVRERAGIDRAPEIIRYSRRGRSGANLYSLAGGAGGERPSRGAEIRLSLPGDLLPRARFLYLWQPFAP